jgi:hypothetical protein
MMFAPAFVTLSFLFLPAEYHTSNPRTAGLYIATNLVSTNIWLQSVPSLTTVLIFLFMETGLVSWHRKSSEKVLEMQE